MHAPAVNDPDQERPAGRTLGGFLPREIRGASLPVQDAGSPQADVFASLRENQRLVHPHACILDRQPFRAVLRIVRKVRTAQQYGSGADLQAYPGAHHDRSAGIFPPFQADNSPVFRRRVHRPLNGGRRLFPGNHPEFLRREHGLRPVPSPGFPGQFIRHGFQFFFQFSTPARDECFLYPAHTGSAPLSMDTVRITFPSGSVTRRIPVFHVPVSFPSILISACRPLHLIP